MIVNTVVDKKGTVMIHTVTGEITFEEIKSSYEAILLHPDFQRDMYAIWDVRDADASKFDSQDVIRLARYFETQIKNRAEFKVAVIVSRDLEYGLSRMYQVAAADLPAKIGIFINLEEAKKWVRESAWGGNSVKA
ncbi:MAG: hypothetical protein KJ687_01410 [Proteobacteria bacterium]|nr:hypothetical protein [Pseudomonadota bacterium]